MNSLTLPIGTKEYVCVVATRVPTGVDPAVLVAKMSVVRKGVDPLPGDWFTADWLPDMNGWGLVVDTAGMVGQYTVRCRVAYGSEVPILGPATLIVQ